MKSSLSMALVCLISFSFAAEVWGSAGSVVTTYPWAAADYVQDPTRPVMYASVSSLNSVAVINTQTLSYQLVPIGSNPDGMTLSPDGSKLYVANSGSSFIGVMNTNTLTTGSPILVPGGANPPDVAFGNNNRLFVIANGIQQIDATTGAVTGPAATVFQYAGTLQISPDRNTLYYGQQGLSPTTMYKIDVSSTVPSVIASITTGSNGRDVTISHDGTMIAHPNGAPYSIAIYRTSDLATLGTLNTGAYPVELAFSPDDKVAYTYTDFVGIGAYSTSTFLPMAPTIPGGVGNEMEVDSSGRYLFASSSTTTVYDTGRSVPATPEPTAAAFLLLGLSGLTLRRRRSR